MTKNQIETIALLRDNDDFKTSPQWGFLVGLVASGDKIALTRAEIDYLSEMATEYLGP